MYSVRNYAETVTFQIHDSKCPSIHIRNAVTMIESVYTGLNSQWSLLMKPLLGVIIFTNMYGYPV